MKRNHLLATSLLFITCLCFNNLAKAGPVWTFTPLTPTKITVPVGGFATIQYVVTNQSQRPHTLIMNAIPGVTQSLASGNCGNPFVLGYHQQCVLTLVVSGSALAGNVVTGPVVCEQGSPLQCYQPAANDFLNISLTAAPSTTTLAFKGPSHVALAVNNPALNPALTGKARTITVTNTGTSTATHVVYTTQGIPTDTTIQSDCNAIAPGESCALTVTPGATPTAAAGNANSSPATIAIKGDNTNALDATVNILTYGSVYQSGYVFAIDDTKPANTSVAGKVAALNDQMADYPGIIWTSNGDGAEAGDVDNYDLTGIYENSQAPCDGAVDGQCNTKRIVSYYNTHRINKGPLPTPVKFYAAGLCAEANEGYNDWYLPAVCELGYDTTNFGSGCGTQAQPKTQNMQSALVDNKIVNAPDGLFWSSTEFSQLPETKVWFQYFSPNGDSLQGTEFKRITLGVRCARSFGQ